MKWALAVFAALGLSVLQTSSAAPTGPGPTTTRVIAPGAGEEPPAECNLGGRKFGGVLYLTGDYMVPGSIYAFCEAGVPKCFVDDGIMDRPTRETIDCSKALTQPKGRSLGVYWSGSRLWPNKVICYRYAEPLPLEQVARFNRVFQQYKAKADVTFINVADCPKLYGRKNPAVCDSCRQSVKISNNQAGCWAHVGYYPAPTVLQLNVGPGCHYDHIYTHELGHVLGLEHEHSHPKRQIIVLRHLIRVPPHNYMRLIKNPTTAYDMSSIMHYDGDEMCIPKSPRGTMMTRYCDIHEVFKINKSWCTVPTETHCDRTRQNEFGRGTTLSAQDIATLKRMYP